MLNYFTLCVMIQFALKFINFIHCDAATTYTVQRPNIKPDNLTKLTFRTWTALNKLKYNKDGNTPLDHNMPY